MNGTTLVRALDQTRELVIARATPSASKSLRNAVEEMAREMMAARGRRHQEVLQHRHNYLVQRANFITKVIAAAITADLVTRGATKLLGADGTGFKPEEHVPATLQTTPALAARTQAKESGVDEQVAYNILMAYRPYYPRLAQAIDTSVALKIYDAINSHVVTERRPVRDFDISGRIQRMAPHYTEIVLRTNVATAVMAGMIGALRARAALSNIVALRYQTAGDDRVRSTHSKMDGFRAGIDARVWTVWLPPNGYNCRCVVVPVTRDEAAASNKLAGTRYIDDPVPPVLPDPNFRGPKTPLVIG